MLRSRGTVFHGWPTPRLFVAAISAFVLAAGSAMAQRPPPEAPAAMRAPAAVARAAIDALAQGCTGNFGSAERIENWARRNDFGPARPEVAAMFAPDAETSVWAYQMTGVNMAIVFRRDGRRCQIFANGADVHVARSHFVGVMEGVRTPGVVVSKEREGEAESHPQLWQIGYRVGVEVRDPQRPDRLLMLTLNPAADARFAIIASVNLVASR